MAEQNKNNDFCSFLKRRNFKSRLKKLTQRLENKKIIIYGAGQLFEEINRHYDLSGLNIIALADRKFNDYEEEKFLNYPAVSPSKIFELSPDYVLVSTLKYFDVVKTMDKDKFDEKNIKIIPFLGIDFINKIKYNECKLSLKNVKERDYIDSHREIAPLKKADEAIYIDSTGMTIEEEANEVIKIIEEKRR